MLRKSERSKTLDVIRMGLIKSSEVARLDFLKPRRLKRDRRPRFAIPCRVVGNIVRRAKEEGVHVYISA
jgi:hypothetical protein